MCAIDRIVKVSLSNWQASDSATANTRNGKPFGGGRGQSHRPSIDASTGSALRNEPDTSAVTLSDTVHSRDERETAANSAWGALGVRDVGDMLKPAH